MKEEIMRATAMRMLVLVMLLSATLAQPAVADLKWEEDGWLATIGLEHLEKGDEFGCYGMPHLSWNADPGAVASECYDYIENRIDASKWGDNPISVYTPSGLSAAQHTVIKNQGLVVHGDNTGQNATAWHHYDDEPEWEYDWYDLGRRGGSLEKEVADIEKINEELDLGGLVNFYWIGRVNDITIRHDRDVVELLENRNDVWFTTWGEAYSRWTVERCYEIDHSLVGGNFSFLHQDSVSCNSAAPNAWNVPVTWKIDIGNGTVLNSTLDQISEDARTTQEGWRTEGNILYASVLRGNEVIFEIDNISEYDILGRTKFFNNKSVAVTIAGHSTTDLFRWSSRFDDNPDLRFTWLISPRALDEGLAWLPYAGIATLLGTVSLVFWVLKNDAKTDSRAEGYLDGTNTRGN